MRRQGVSMVDVELAGVGRSLGSVRALDGIDLTLGSGITGLLGPNGAGKTTLLRILATVLAPDTGRVMLLGRDPRRAEQRVEIRRRLGYVPQEPGFYRNFTALDFVDYVAILKQLTDPRRRAEEVRRVLDAVELTGVANQKVKALSGGMRQRLALAQALVGSPELLVLDEPLVGLDPEQKLRFRAVVSQLAGRPVVVLSTHQTEDVAAFCSRVVVLAGGRVRFDGTPTEMTAAAHGRVWLTTEPAGQAVLTWRMADGRFRNLGHPPVGAELAVPTIDDAYLVLAGRNALAVPA
jgi:ABC-2 type transport system ATP-binding protein